ncbi:hypothetical protein LJK88_24180 [Paenibacillus sp. P26]|nr:hypothetical protein LJK88_24180 [Paenibacillus sp. P26]
MQLWPPQTRNGRPSARAAPAKKASLLFDCGPGQTADGYTQLLPSTAFTEKLGYGFEDISKVDSRTGTSPMRCAAISVCPVALPSW